MDTNQRHNVTMRSASDLDSTGYQVLDSMVGFSTFPLVFLRKNLGFRLLQSPRVGLHCLLFLIWSYVVNGGTSVAAHVSRHARQEGQAMFVYALAYIVLNVYHTRRGLALVMHPTRPLHTMSRGNSYLAGLIRFLPEAVIQYFIEPVLLIGLGYWLINKIHWPLLGWWFCIAGCSLFIVETLVRDNAVREMLDVRDSRIHAQSLKATEDAITGKRNSPASAAAASKKATNGNIVSLSPEVIRLKPGTTNRHEG